jgi:hypothetical protein
VLIRRLVRIGVLDKARMRLSYMLVLKIEDFLERDGCRPRRSRAVRRNPFIMLVFSSGSYTFGAY